MYTDNMSRITFLLIALFLASSAMPVEIDYGLQFRSYSVLGKDRTGLILENNESIEGGKTFNINFDLQIKNETLFGSIIRIITESGNSIILSLGRNEHGEPIPVLLINDQIKNIKNQVIIDKWFNVDISISNTDKTITLRYNNFIETFTDTKNKWDKFRICFGSSSINNFVTEEVPPISLRNIKLTRDDKLFRHWVLGKHNKAFCYDEIENIKAIAYNPDWIIDKYTELTKKLSLNFANSNYTQYAFDPKNNNILIVPNEKEIIIYNPKTNIKRVINVLGGVPASLNTNQLIFDTQKRQLISYNLEEQYLSTFSFETNRWSNDRLSTKETLFWHHTADFWTKDSTILTFGGYGMYSYKNDLFKIGYNNKWTINKLQSIPKRHSAASCILNDTLFIFSGEGNEIGKQELPIQIYNDLYAIDLKTYKVSLIWKMPNESFGLPCGNMIYSPLEKCFYALTSRDGGSLLKISKNRPSIELLMTNNSQLLEADFNFYTLMKPDGINKIYAFYCRDYKSGSSKIDIYETFFPPISKENALQNEPDKANFIYLLLLIVIVILLVAVFTRIRILRSKTSSNINKKELNNISNNEHYNLNETTLETHLFDRSRKSISLLGAFNVRDKNGNDITNLFAPVLKTILLVIILKGHQDDQGVNSNLIDTLLWPDKDKKATRNNRNVSINRLNNVLENIGDIRIYSDGNFWKLEIADDTFCDYFAVSKIMKLPEKEIINNKDLSTKLLELLSYGQLLPFTQLEWLDAFKAVYSNFSLDILSAFLEKEDVRCDAKLKLKIAEIISLFDSINENALHIKCNIQYVLGKKALAKFTYDNFCKEYESLLGEKYPISFVKIIDG